MKKLLSIILAGLLIFSLAACTQSPSGNEDGSGVSQKDGGKRLSFPQRFRDFRIILTVKWFVKKSTKTVQEAINISIQHLKNLRLTAHL